MNVVIFDSLLSFPDSWTYYTCQPKQLSAHHACRRTSHLLGRGAGGQMYPSNHITMAAGGAHISGEWGVGGRMHPSSQESRTSDDWTPCTVQAGRHLCW